MITHNTHKRQTYVYWWDSILQFQHATVGRRTPRGHCNIQHVHEQMKRNKYPN